MAARLTKLFFKKSQPCNVVIRYTCLAVHKIIRSEIKILIQNKQQFLHIFFNILARSSYICSFNPNSEIWGVLGRKKQIWMEKSMQEYSRFLVFYSFVAVEDWSLCHKCQLCKVLLHHNAFQMQLFYFSGIFLFIWHTYRKFRICRTFFFWYWKEK